MPYSNKIVCKGYWFLENIRIGIVIEESDIMYGSGDYEDPPEIYNDKVVKCYYIWSCAAGSIDNYSVGIGCCERIEEAKVYAENKCGKIVWQ